MNQLDLLFEAIEEVTGYDPDFVISEFNEWYLMPEQARVWALENYLGRVSNA